MVSHCKNKSFACIARNHVILLVNTGKDLSETIIKKPKQKAYQVSTEESKREVTTDVPEETSLQ